MNELDLIPFRTLLDHVVVPARRYGRSMILPVALPLATVSCLFAIVQVWWTETLTTADPDDLGATCGVMVLMLVLSLATLLIYVLASGAMTVAAMDAIAGRPVRMNRAWAFVMTPSVFGTLLLVGMLDFLSVLTLALPALYVIPLLSFTLPVMAEEGLVGTDAIRRSMELFRFNPTGRFNHNPWPQVLVLMLVGMVIGWILSFTVQAPFAIAQQVIIFREAASGQEALEQLKVVYWLQIPASVLGSLASAVAWLYPAFGTCLLFRELRRRKEAPDMTAAVDRLVRS